MACALLYDGWTRQRVYDGRLNLLVRCLRIRLIGVVGASGCLDEEKGNSMIPKPLHGAAQVLRALASNGCQVRVEESALVVHDPHRTLTNELRDEIGKHKLAILALLMREALLHLVRVLDMSQPTINVGMQEEYATALLAAMRLVGDPWVEEEGETDLWDE